MGDYKYIILKEMPSIKERAAEWFHSKWGVPTEAYLECMEEFLSGETEYGWYLCLDGDKIIAGLGVIENDFHDRKDLKPFWIKFLRKSEAKLLNLFGYTMKRFIEINGSAVCRELLGYDLTKIEDMQIIKDKNLFRTFCPEMVRSAANILDEMINEGIC